MHPGSDDIEKEVSLKETLHRTTTDDDAAADTHSRTSETIDEEADDDGQSIGSVAPTTPAADEETQDAENGSPVVRRVTTEIGPPVVVSRLKRRGLFGQIALVAEVENAQAYPRRTKWFLTFVVAFAAVAAPLGSSIFLPSLSQVAQDMNTSPTVTNLSVALYMLSMSIFPLWWSSFSEAFGRRSIYVVSFAIFVVFNVLSAVSTSIGMLIVMRMLSGGASASVQAVGAGSIADMWEVRERGRAMGIFYIGPLCGPLFAPIIGGALAQRWGWRSTLWFMVIFGGVALVFIVLTLPETLSVRRNPLVEAERSTVSLDRTASRVSSHMVRNTTKWLKVLTMVLVDPFKIILYLKYTPVFLSVFYASITFGSLYCLNISVQESFTAEPYHFSTIIIGLLYLPNSLGYLITSIFGGKWMDNIMHREATKAGRYDEKGRPIYQPEDRMRENAWLGAILWPAALIWYGWTVEKGIHWIVPMIANFFFGIGSMLIFGIVTTMLTEFMPKRSSSGVALNNFVRNIFSCVGIIVTSPILRGIGNGWFFTILGLVGVVSGALVIFTMRKMGPKWRKSMDALKN